MSNSIEFKLFAPYNKAVNLVGSFSDWQDIGMQKDEQGCFRASVELNDGAHQYKFRVQSKRELNSPDQWVEINDPYAKMLDLETGNGIVQVEAGQLIVDNYIWQYDDTPLPADHELVIYELLVPNFFGHDHSRDTQYQQVSEKLDYLSELGINAIELMPLNATPGDYSWGYNPSYFFAPNPRYGSTADLKQLIDQCHSRGIRVILDQLFNHSSEESPLLKIDHDYWYYHDRHHPDDPYYWGPEFNYEHYDEKLDIRPAWHFMGDAVRFWIQEYHIDGIRFDALKQLDNWDFLYWITQEAKQAAGSKPFYNIAEHVPEKPDIVAPDGPMDSCWHDSFCHTLSAHLLGKTFDLDQLQQVLNAKQQGYPEGVTKVINYLSNHDQPRLLESLGEQGVLDEAAFKRAKLGAVLLMTAVGTPLIWMGEEFGEFTKLATDKPEKITWSRLENDSNRGLLEFYKGLIALRQQNSALHTSNIQFFHENPEQRVFAYGRWNDQGSRIVVIANLSDQFLENYAVPQFPNNGRWHEWTRDYDLEAKADQLTLDLAEYEAQVFVQS